MKSAPQASQPDSSLPERYEDAVAELEALVSQMESGQLPLDRLLVETDLPIQDISAQCGYASVNTFYKAFQRTYSTAPNAMRRELAAEN